LSTLAEVKSDPAAWPAYQQNTHEFFQPFQCKNNICDNRKTISVTKKNNICDKKKTISGAIEDIMAKIFLFGFFCFTDFGTRVTLADSRSAYPGKATHDPGDGVQASSSSS